MVFELVECLVFLRAENLEFLRADSLVDNLVEHLAVK